MILFRYTRFTFFFSILLLVSAATNAQSDNQRIIDSLQKLVDTAPNDSIKIRRYLDLAWRENDARHLMKLKEALNYAGKKDYKYGIALVELRISRYYMFNDVDYPLATYWATHALKICLDNKLLAPEAQCYQQLGIISYGFKDNESAMSYFQRSRSINQKLNNLSFLKTNLNMIGLVYKSINQFDSAMFYYQRSLKICLQEKIPAAVVYVNISSCFIYMDMLDSAKKYIRITDSTYNASKSKYGKFWVNMLRGQVEMKEGNAKDALLLFEDSYEYGKKENDTELLLELMPSFVKAHKIAGNFKEAFSKLEELNLLNDSVNGTKKTANFMSIRKKFEEEQRSEITQLKQEKTQLEHRVEIGRRNRIIWGSGILLAIVSLFGFFVLRGYRQKQKDNKEITEQKKIIEEKQKEILDSIHYAKRIQNALIPNEKQVEKSLNKLQNDSK